MNNSLTKDEIEEVFARELNKVKRIYDAISKEYDKDKRLDTIWGGTLHGIERVRIELLRKLEQNEKKQKK